MLPILLMIDEITQEDERELLRRLFFTYAPKMKLLAQSILKNEADAEDALHDTFLLVIRYRKKFVQADEIEIKRLLVIYSRSVCFNRLRREIVWLRYYAGHTNVEIGALLGIKPSTVGSTLRRSLKEIQNETEAYFVDR